MTLSTLTEQCNTLSLSGFKQSLLLQSEDSAYSALSFEERLYHLFEAEINQRQDKRIKRMLTQAHFKEKGASLNQVEYQASRGLNKALILSLAQCTFINQNQNILITGATGVGKSFLAQALAKRAITLGYSVRYYRVSTLLEEIKMARLDGSYTKFLTKLSRFKLLILDDFGVSPLQSDEVNNLFEIIEERMFNGAVIITAQLPISEWHAYLGNETIADAMMDRLIHTAHKVNLKGESMRKMMANI